MATNFPNAKDSFPTMKDVTAADAILLAQYQSAMQAGEIAKAKQLLAQMTDGANKVITAEYLNNIKDAMDALETYYLQRWSPAYVVSDTQPVDQATGDFWFDTGGNA